MAPSEYCKSKGLTGLKQVADITGVQYRTLINWYKDKNKLFCVVVDGCMVELIDNFYSTVSIPDLDTIRRDK